MKNRTAYLKQAEQIVMEDSPMPEVGPDDVLIEIKHVTICGSDVHFYTDPTYGGRIVPPILPIILGHECAGVVLEIGKNVKNVAVGDRVAVEPGAGCGTCEYCLGGRYNLCPEMDFMAAPPFHRGAFSRYVSHPAKMVFPLPDNMDTIDGALMEPLAVGMHAARRGGVQVGDTVLVMGAGCIGLMTIAAAKAMGAAKVIVSDLYENRLEGALSMGADVAINASKEDVKTRVGELTEGKGPDLIFETAGSQKTASMTVELIKPGGKIVMVGNVHGQTPFEFMEANNKEADVVSVFRYVNMYPTAIKAVSSGKIKVRDMISKTFPFEEVAKAFECAVNEQDTVMKIVVEF